MVLGVEIILHVERIITIDLGFYVHRRGEIFIHVRRHDK